MIITIFSLLWGWSGHVTQLICKTLPSSYFKGEIIDTKIDDSKSTSILGHEKKSLHSSQREFVSSMFTIVPHDPQRSYVYIAQEY